MAQVRADIKRLQEREIMLRALLVANPDIRTGANYLAEIREVQTTRLDTKELRANYPDIAAQFTFSVTTTRVELSGISEDGELVGLRKFRQLTAESTQP